ncbi:MAG: YcfA-like protein [Methanobacterium sp. PtaU1.Bin097]|jgi:predicted RNA binding protein YcfA (HicA-like mRNA interferase family)|nr:MAG: YcfA-like protein [Methanobacterium sp. PtaU1.Bin097]
MATQKLPILSGLEICKTLSRDGFREVSRKGSHIKMKKRLDSGRILTVIVPDHKKVKKGTLKAIINQAGLNNQIFLDLL